MKLGELKTAWDLWRGYGKLEKAIEEETKMGYDFKIGAAKALRDFAITSAAVGGAAILSYFAVPENLAKVLGVLPDSVEKAAIAVISPLIVLALNYVRERNR